MNEERDMPAFSGSNDSWIEKRRIREQIAGSCTYCRPHSGENRRKGNRPPQKKRKEWR